MQTYPKFAHNPSLNMPYPLLFSPQRLGPITLKNRAIVSSLTRASATQDGLVTPLMKSYYTDYGRGGWGMIATEATYIDQKYSQGYSYQPGIANQQQADSWAEVVEAVHAQGTPIYMQLFHAGSVNQGNHWVSESIAPSAVRPKSVQVSRYRGNNEPFQMPRVMTQQEIDEVIVSFAEAARRAISVGFDGVEIHGANGYLPDQFLTTYTNQRTDRYNGDVMARLRFHLELLNAVRAAIPGKLLGVRISQTKVTDLEYSWPGQVEDAQVIFSEIAKTDVDFIHVAAHHGVNPVFGTSKSLSGLAKEYSGLPIIANGKLHEPLSAESALKNGEGDFVSIGKGALADPHWPNKLLAGQVPIEFVPDMISPLATLENYYDWRTRTSGSDQ